MRLTLLITAWALLLSSQALVAAEAEPSFARLITTGGFSVGAPDRPILHLHESTTFIPASTIKLVTALTALEILGPSHRFTTEFYRQDGTLFIKGQGDPSLTSAEVAGIAAALKAAGVETVSALVLDDSFFALRAPADGSGTTSNPYDAPNAALAVNFNAVPLLIDDTGRIASGEAETPLIPLMTDIGRQLPPGRHRVNVAAYPADPGLSPGLRYVAELFTALCREAGIAVTGPVRRGVVNPGAQLILTHHSRKTVAHLVRDCLKFSNNFIANQLYLSCGAQRYGYPATWPKARRAQHAVLTERFALALEGLSLIEGSGLSRRNRVTPTFLTAILEAFKPYAALLPEERPGLLLKSGTLNGVYCYAGYFTATAAPVPFVILLNQPRNTRKEVLALLHGNYLSSLSASPPLKPRAAGDGP